MPLIGSFPYLGCHVDKAFSGFGTFLGRSSRAEIIDIAQRHLGYEGCQPLSTVVKALMYLVVYSEPRTSLRRGSFAILLAPSDFDVMYLGTCQAPIWHVVTITARSYPSLRQCFLPLVATDAFKST